MTSSNSMANIPSSGMDISGIINTLGNHMDLDRLATQIFNAVDTWIKVIQEEPTKRAEIQAWEATQRESIIAQRDILIKGLDLTFDERRETFQRLFDVLDQAMQKDDAQIVADVLEKITELAKSSPFKDLGNVQFLVQELKNSERTWTV